MGKMLQLSVKGVKKSSLGSAIAFFPLFFVVFFLPLFHTPPALQTLMSFTKSQYFAGT